MVTVSQIPLQRLIGNKLATSLYTGKLSGNVCNRFWAIECQEWICLYVCVCLAEAELSFLKSLATFAHQMSTLNLNETELALLCALVLVNPSK